MAYIPQHYYPEDAEKASEPKKKFHFFPIFLLALFTVLMYLSTLVWNYTWQQLEIYEANHIKYAEEAFMEKFRLNRIDDILDEKAPEYDIFNSRDEYMQYMLDTFGSDYTSAKSVKGKTLDDGSVLYDVYLGNIKFAGYTVTPKSSGGWTYSAEDLNDSLFVKTKSFKACVPVGAKAYANGVQLEKSFISEEKYEIHDFDDLDDKSLIPQFEVYETGNIFLNEPEILITCADGGDMTVTEEKGVYYALPVPTEEQTAELKAAAEEAAIVYAKYITKDTSFESLKKYLVSDSEFYRRIKNFYHDWYRDHTVTYDNVEFSDITMYNENCFRLHIAFDYHVNIGYKVNDYDVEYTMCMIKLDGEWKIASMIM
ncbi:MAG: hypothetical protein ACI4KG_04745 [Oscillospiraceae bacterium]